jgi:hypothetical protein
MFIHELVMIKDSTFLEEIKLALNLEGPVELPASITFINSRKVYGGNRELFL